MQKIIGVFDSGVGGMTTAREIQKLLPDAKLIYFGDSEHCPYGERTQEDLINITSEIVQNLQNQGAELIVIACNTATTQCIHALRERFPALTFVGTEPAIKVACDLGCQKILLMATPGTVKSTQVQKLCDKYITNQEITLLPCAGLAELIERDITARVSDDIFHPSEETLQKLNELLGDLSTPNGFDAVVLGCTHYIYLKDVIQTYFPKARLVDGNLGVAKRVKQLMTQN